MAGSILSVSKCSINFETESITKGAGLKSEYLNLNFELSGFEKTANSFKNYKLRRTDLRLVCTWI